MTTIYLSSTYEDLKEYRGVVFEALRKAGYQVKAMEDYVATDSRPVDKCLDDVAEADIYVGLFAFRYGYVPPPEHGNPDGLSITELEFRHAEKLRKPCLAFVVSEDAPWPPKFIDGLKGERINRLRQYLLKQKAATFFSNPQKLASLVVERCDLTVKQWLREETGATHAIREPLKEFERRLEEARREEERRLLEKDQLRRKEEVHLGAAAPRAVCPGEEFVARFAAYTQAYRSEVNRVIEKESPSSLPRLDLETCQWRPGTKVTVRLDARYLKVSNPIQTFKWNGTWCVLRFDAKVPVNIDVNTVVLRFDIAVEGFPIVAIRPEIAVSRKKRKKEETSSVSVVVEQTAPRSAFASYAREDSRDVLGRVRSVQIFTGIKVFLDCLSIRPGEEWKSKLKKEINECDVFWLFWSRSAMASEWVEWEWRTALSEKSLAAIQPHPLEPSELAPPPEELSSLQFGAMYEWYVSQLSESRG